MRQFCQAMTKPCMANLVPGGKTPILPPAQLQDVGYKLALYPVMLMSSAVAAMQATLAALRPGAAEKQPPAISFVDLQRVVGFPDYWERETQYKANT
jgi:2-methylisocitrate lyase-like PEP mutase family enzyme